MPRNLELQNAQVFGQVEYKGGVQFLAAAGAVDPNCAITDIKSGAAIALTLAAPVDGQQKEKIIFMSVDGGDATLTPASLLGAFNTITFTAVGQSAHLLYSIDNAGWIILGYQGVTLA
jgi:hypothetical protein